MRLVDTECVRKLLESTDPDATLVFVCGECVVLPGGQVDERHQALVVARREDLVSLLSDRTLTDRDLEELAHRLDNTVRDLGA
ncbi:hypothetical protein [Thermoactinospora rubra]|uniref:hypothetical protein n=1 Tax=Thermoactinospora rubra TaxID=1088767 RepID=UPI000A0FBF04|nr:hypothetical protein [Thermoactinospora rubra]